MTDNEMQICERFKIIRKELGMKQGVFAKEIKTTQGHVSDIENKRKGVSDRVIEIICLKFNVNEDWLRTGKGEKFLQLTEKDQLILWASTALSHQTEEYRSRFVNVLSKLDIDDWELLANMAETLAKQKKKD